MVLRPFEGMKGAVGVAAFCDASLRSRYDLHKFYVVQPINKFVPGSVVHGFPRRISHAMFS